MEPVLQPGEVVDGRYRIVGLLGRGGVATTYEAESLADGARVALKQLWLWHQHDWKVLELFEREVRVLAELTHPLIPRYVESFQVQTDQGACYYLAQERAAGRSLAGWIASGWQPSEPEVRAVADQVLGVLEYLQRRVPPVLHRDIKPENLIRGDDGTVRVVDFGAVRDTFRTLAHGSTVVGTFGYMAPEQLHGQAVAATDLYGLGATLVFLLTRRTPSSLPQKRGRLDWRRGLRVSRQLAAFVDKLIAPQPEGRYRSAAQARLVLRRLDRARRRSAIRYVVDVVALVVLVVVGWHYVRAHFWLGEPSHQAIAELDPRTPTGRLRFVRSFVGQLAPVDALAWLPDNKQLVAGDRDGAVRLWDATTGKQVRAFAGHTGIVTAVAVTPDGHEIVSASFDKTVRVWAVDTGKQLRVLGGHGSAVFSAAVSRDGKLVASGDDDGKILIHDLSTGQELHAMSQSSRVLWLAFGRDRMLATASNAGPIRLWDASTGKLEAVLKGHRGPVDKVAFTPDGETLVSAGDDQTLRVWTLGVKRLARTIHDHTGQIWALSVSPDGQRIASAGADDSLVVEDLFSNTLRARREHVDSLPLSTIAFRPDGKQLAAAGRSRMLRLWAVAAPSWHPAWVTAPVPHAAKKPPKGLSKAGQLCFRAEALMDSDETKLAKAKPLLDEALADDPRSACAFTGLGRLAYKSGYVSYWDYSPESLVRAHELFDKALAIAPDLYEAHLYKAYAYLFQKKYDDAIKQAKLAESAKPGAPRTQVFYVSFEERRRDTGEMMLHARALIEGTTDPELLASAYDGLETVYAKRGEWDAVDKCYTSIINLEPDSAWAKGNYAAFLVRQARYDDAIDMAKRAIRQRDYPMVHSTLAKAYAGKAEQALSGGGKR